MIYAIFDLTDFTTLFMTGFSLGLLLSFICFGLVAVFSAFKHIILS